MKHKERQSPSSAALGGVARRTQGRAQNGWSLEEAYGTLPYRSPGCQAVPHGFRSSFRDWAAEETDHPREVIEAALAHVVQNKVEAANAHSFGCLCDY